MAQNVEAIRQMVVSVARRFGIPPELALAQIKQESGFNPAAKSGAGAEGIAQFMPATGREYGVTDPFNVQQALNGYGRMMSSLIKKDGVAGALSAYNSGNSQAYKDPNFAHGQTYNYVKDILASSHMQPGAGLASNPNSKGAQVFPGGTPPAQGGASQLLLGSLLDRTNAFAQGKPSSTNPMQALQAMLASANTPAPDTAATAAPTHPRSLASADTTSRSNVALSGQFQGLKPSFVNNLERAAGSLGATGINIISGRRSADHNAAVGGVPGSNHLTGDAADGYLIINGKQVPLGVALRAIAGKFGLRSGDVPGFFNGGPDPNHVDDGMNQRA